MPDRMRRNYVESTMASSSRALHAAACVLVLFTLAKDALQVSAAGSKVGGPIVTDLRACGEPDLPANALPPLQCCPPKPASEPVSFRPPNPAEPLRIRRPAHDKAAVAKYERAIALMKALPSGHPHSFYQQAAAHCAYCSGAHRQAGRPDLRVRVHHSWLFFAFHRAFLYFFERIAGKLLGDPGFALPFWSWDVPEGMRMPAAFANSSSPLFDRMRNPRHAPPRVVDLDFSGKEDNLTDQEQIQHNLRIMYKQMVSNAVLPSLFLGQPLRAGDVNDMPGAGALEMYPHNAVHTWTGDTSRRNGEDMGVFYSAARDPLFYSHHCNVDRLWDAWRRAGAGRADFADPDWLDSSFLFYDEEARLVRVAVRDVLDVGRLRYRYEGVGMPWLNARPPPATPGAIRKKGGGGATTDVMAADAEYAKFPMALDAAVTAEVRRPSMLRTRLEKAAQEVLVIDGIESDGTEVVKFDVYVNSVEREKADPSKREMAESFMSLKQPNMEDARGKAVGIKTSMRVALNELLRDLGAERDRSVTVTLVPRHGKVTVGGLRIEYMVE